MNSTGNTYKAESPQRERAIGNFNNSHSFRQCSLDNYRAFLVKDLGIFFILIGIRVTEKNNVAYI